VRKPDDVTWVLARIWLIRSRRHDAGESKATKHGVPRALIHSKAFATRAEVAQREQYYKTGRGRDELDKLLVELSPRRQLVGSNRTIRFN